MIGRFPDETSCLTLVWAVVDLYIGHATDGVKFTQLERQRLKRIRYEGSDHAIREELTLERGPGRTRGRRVRRHRRASGRTPDQTGVADAVGRRPARPLDGPVAGERSAVAVEAWEVVRDGPHEAEAYGQPVTVERLVDWAIDRAVVGTRNATGFALACQLRDNGVAYDEAHEAMLSYWRSRATTCMPARRR